MLEIQSSPTGARVSRNDTGDLVGVTPLEVKLDRAEGTVTLKFELEGRQTIERQVSLARNNSLSVDLSAVAAPVPVVPDKPEPKAPSAKATPKKKAPVSKDGVVDPFDK